VQDQLFRSRATRYSGRGPEIVNEYLSIPLPAFKKRTRPLPAYGIVKPTSRLRRVRSKPAIPIVNNPPAPPLPSALSRSVAWLLAALVRGLAPVGVVGSAAAERSGSASKTSASSSQDPPAHTRARTRTRTHIHPVKIPAAPGRVGVVRSRLHVEARRTVLPLPL
jgi:hypothetical protein